MSIGMHTWGAVGWLVMTLFWVALVALAVVAVTRLFPRGATAHGPREDRSDAPREILDRRLAAGEIDIETYERLRSTLDAEG